MSLAVFLLGDHEVVRTGLRLPETGDAITGVGEPGTAADALSRVPRQARRGHPRRAGERRPRVEVCREVRSADPDIVCVMLTSSTDDEAPMTSITAGAAGYVLRQIGSFDLLDTIRRAGAGEFQLSGPSRYLCWRSAFPHSLQAASRGLTGPDVTTQSFSAVGVLGYRAAEE